MDKRFAIGNFIYELRTEKGWTQKELGDMLGVTNKAVSKWETGAALPRIECLRDLAVILGCTQEELFLGRRIPKDETEPAEAPEESYLSVVQRCDACHHEGKWVSSGFLKGKFVCKNCGAEIKREGKWNIISYLVYVFNYTVAHVIVFILNGSLGIYNFFAGGFPTAEEAAFFRQLHEHFPRIRLVGLLADCFITFALFAILFGLYELLKLFFKKKHWIKYRIVHYPHSEDGKIVF